jgi:anti-sigma factor RsiW
VIDCGDVRPQLAGASRAPLAPEVRAHLETCAACARYEAAEQALTESLERHVPQYPASLALKRRLAEQWETAALRASAARRRRWRIAVPALAAAAILIVALPVYLQRATPTGMVAEAVNDHLRVLRGDRPLEVQSGELHQVRPWFEGRLDFAPVVTFAGDAEFPLKGGAVEYFLDRKAAAFVYKRRLHTITLLVFRADGLPLSPAPQAAQRHGFNVRLWRAGDLGYALVSDVDGRELEALAGLITWGASKGPPSPPNAR